MRLTAVLSVHTATVLSNQPLKLVDVAIETVDLLTANRQLGSRAALLPGARDAGQIGGARRMGERRAAGHARPADLINDVAEIEDEPKHDPLRVSIAMLDPDPLG